MKATDIQINDFVFVKSKNKIGIVHEIYTRSCHIWCGETYGSVYSDRYEYDDIEPIPLTPEILKKNGWIFIEGQDYSTFPVPSKWTYQFVPFALRVDRETYRIANTFIITYVHQLQHALRLCRLDELADNIKV